MHDAPPERRDELAALRGELVAVRAALREVCALLEPLVRDRSRPSRLTRRDRERLGRILPAVGGSVGSELFATRELFASQAPAVRVALHGENPKGLGRLFLRAAGTTCGRYTIRAEGRELNATLWRILQVDEFLTR